MDNDSDDASVEFKKVFGMIKSSTFQRISKLNLFKNNWDGFLDRSLNETMDKLEECSDEKEEG